jgi:hypothetical protein
MQLLSPEEQVVVAFVVRAVEVEKAIEGLNQSKNEVQIGVRLLKYFPCEGESRSVQLLPG